MEEAVSIPGPGITLEGRLSVGAAPGGAVITHPHPLFGGDMANNVVLTAVRALAARGMSALRFNFRGVGRSTGTYGGGIEEADDVAAALAFLKSRTPGPHYVVGYSFGAAVAGRALLKGLSADGAHLHRAPHRLHGPEFSPPGAGAQAHCGGGSGRTLSPPELAGAHGGKPACPAGRRRRKSGSLRAPTISSATVRRSCSRCCGTFPSRHGSWALASRPTVKKWQVE